MSFSRKCSLCSSSLWTVSVSGNPFIGLIALRLSAAIPACKREKNPLAQSNKSKTKPGRAARDVLLWDFVVVPQYCALKLSGWLIIAGRNVFWLWESISGRSLISFHAFLMSPLSFLMHFHIPHLLFVALTFYLFIFCGFSICLESLESVICRNDGILALSGVCHSLCSYSKTPLNSPQPVLLSFSTIDMFCFGSPSNFYYFIFKMMWTKNMMQTISI